jgi:hypothetical protein
VCAGSQALQRAGAGADPERGRYRHDPAGERLSRRLARPRGLRVQERGGQGAHRTARVPGAGVLHQGSKTSGSSTAAGLRIGSGSTGSTCFGSPGSGSISQMYGSGSFYHHAKIVRKTLIPTVLLLLLHFIFKK